MAKSNYINKNDSGFSAQTLGFKNNIGSYAALLGLSAAQVLAQAADADYFAYVLGCQQAMQNGAQQWTIWKDLTRDGGTLPSDGAPVAPVFSAPVTPVAPGIEARFRALAQQIKANPNYNPAMGKALGIEGAEQAGPDLTTVQPEIGAAINGGRVDVSWGWNGCRSALDMCELQVDRGDGKGFVVLAYDTTPGYVDTAPFPPVPTRWTYKAIYRVDDAQTGQWSKLVSITVGG